MLRVNRFAHFRTLAAILAVTAAGASPLWAQKAVIKPFEVRAIGGALVPTGDQKDLLETAPLAGVQAGWRFHPNFAITGSFAWAGAEDKTTAISGNTFFTGRNEKVDAFQYDLGLEARYPIVSSKGVATPYIGLGGGGRTYRFRDIDDVDSQTNALGFGSFGIELSPPSQRFAGRVEVRDNVTAFKGLRGELVDRTARNDLQVSGGLSVRF